jgi:hypothetical protein
MTTMKYFMQLFLGGGIISQMGTSQLKMHDTLVTCYWQNITIVIDKNARLSEPQIANTTSHLQTSDQKKERVKYPRK